MRFIFLLIVLFLSSIFYSQALFTTDTIKHTTLNYGLKLGNNLAYIPDVFEEVKENKPKVGLYVGGFLNYPISKKWEVQLETFYAKQGTDAVFLFSNDVFTEGIDLNAGVSLDYISIPLQFKYNINEKWYLGTGGYIAFLVNEQLHLSTTEKTERDYGVFVDHTGSFEEIRQVLADIGYDFDVQKEKLDYGLQFEGGVALSPNVILNARYILGLHDIIKSDSEDIEGSPTNSVFTLGFDYRF